MKGPVCLAMPAVVRETHIPRSTVHVNCFIPPTLLLSLLDTETIKQVWTASHVWILSLYVPLSVCVSVPSLYFPVPVPLSLLFESSLPSWTSSLARPRRPWNSCLAKRDNHRRLFFLRSYLLWNLGGELKPSLKLKAKPKGREYNCWQGHLIYNF